MALVVNVVVIVVNVVVIVVGIVVAMVVMTIAGLQGTLLIVVVVIILPGALPMVDDHGGTGPGPLILLEALDERGLELLCEVEIMVM